MSKKKNVVGSLIAADILVYVGIIYVAPSTKQFVTNWKKAAELKKTIGPAAYKELQITSKSLRPYY